MTTDPEQRPEEISPSPDAPGEGVPTAGSEGPIPGPDETFTSPNAISPSPAAAGEGVPAAAGGGEGSLPVADAILAGAGGGEGSPVEADSVLAAPTDEPAPFSVSIQTLAWIAISLLFLATHLGPVWRLPVAGAEWVHISGAWQAHAGVADSRFVPTLFQALTAATFSFSSEVEPARVLAMLATLSIPAAFWLVRERLGVAGALFAIALLAIDGPSIVSGTSASAMGFDLAVTAWLFAAFVRRPEAAWIWAALAALVAVGGPIPLPLAAAFVLIHLGSGGKFARIPTIAAVVGAIGGTLVAGFVLAPLFGLGVSGLQLPPFVILSKGFSEAWSVGSTGDLFLTYQVPLAVLGLAGVALSYDDLRRNRLRSERALPAAWLGLSLLWFAVSFNSHNPAPLVSVALAAAVCAGPFVAHAFDQLFEADWTWARWLLPAAALLLLISAGNIADWARADHVSPLDTELAVLLCLGGAATAMGWLAISRTSAPTLLAPLLAVGALWMVATNLGAAIGVGNEPLVGPETSGQADELRAVALATIADHGGQVIVHPDFANDVTWAFRDSTTLVIASRVPPDASFVIWPATLAKPAGDDKLTRLDGTWSLRQATPSPATTLLKYFHWLLDRNIILPVHPAIAVYIRTAQ